MRWRAVTIALVAILAAGTIGKARCDLARRDPETIRGDAEVWRRVTFLPGGAAAYLAFGRRGERAA